MIHSIDYDAANRDVSVIFRSKDGNAGDRWIYHAVPESVYQTVVSDASVGKAFNAHIKKKFQASKR
jgi:hypothetical protein